MKVLGLASYPIEAAATRYRLAQFVEPLKERGIALDVRPFLDSAQFHALYGGGPKLSTLLSLERSVRGRLADVFRARRYDLLFVQREAMFFGPAFFEWIYQRAGRLPLVLDLDDATYVRYVSPTYGRLGSFFKFFGKTDRLIERAATVICGNRFIAEYVERKGTPTAIVPTVVDTDLFKPVEHRHAAPVIGWVGTHSTYPSLVSLFPVLRALAGKYEFTLKIVGAGVERIDLEGVEVENLPWSLARELADFQSLDIGLYPITTSGSANEQWILGKSGFKAIQYMALGLPSVIAPVGVCAEIGEPGVTHLAASTPEEWAAALEALLASAERRRAMGAAARAYSLAHYTIGQLTGKIEKVFRDAVGRPGRV